MLSQATAQRIDHQNNPREHSNTRVSAIAEGGRSSPILVEAIRTIAGHKRRLAALRTALVILLPALVALEQVGRAQNIFPPPSGGAATSCSTTGANWLTCNLTGGVLTIAPATGQTAHQLIGTANGSSFGPITLTSADLPLSSMGTITGGTWNGGVVGPTYGGTGVNNGSFTATLSGNVTVTGAFNPTFAIPSSSTWTFPSGGGTLLTAIMGGSCTNQAVTGISTAGAPTCTTITHSYVDNSIAQTGADINTSNQVISTHLSSPLPFSQGGLGISSNFAAHNWFGNNAGSTATPSAAQPACGDLINAATSCSTDATNASNISSGTLSTARQANTTYAAYFGGGLSAATIAGSTTDYITIGVSTPGTAIGLKVWAVTQACTLRNLIVFTTGAQPSGGSLVFTLYDNGASTPGTLGSSTGLTVAFAASASASIQEDSTDTYAVSANHWLTLQVVNNSSTTSATISAWAVACEPN